MRITPEVSGPNDGQCRGVQDPIPGWLNHRVMGQKSVDQGMGPMPRSGMNHHAGRLIDPKDMGIFVKNGQCHRLRQNHILPGLGQGFR